MSKNTITCKKCGSEIEISEALTHQIEEQVLASINVKHKEELAAARKEAEELVNKKVEEQFAMKMKALSKENEEEKERNKKLTGQLDELLEQMRELKRKDGDREIEMKKKLMEEEEKIRQNAVKQTTEEFRLKDMEKDKKLTDALKQIEELKTKMQQGSQQTQGEVLELELEKVLKREFPTDNLIEVKKGERGADIIHEIVDKLGRKCGTILWETKNAKWAAEWISKLKEDQRNKRADLAVLVTINKPENLDSFTYKDGVWLTTWEAVVPLAFALRFNIISVYHEKSSSEGRKEKMDIMYQYLMGVEFRHRVEAIVEGFSNMQQELEREKRWFSAKWSRQEKEIRKVLDNTHGMYGDLQGIIGRSLPDIKTLELPDNTED